MPALTLLRDQRVWLDGAMHVVRGRIQGEAIHLERLDDGTMTTLSHPDLAERIALGRAQLMLEAGTGRESRLLQENMERDVSALPELRRKELQRRLDYIKAVEEGGISTLTERSLAGTIGRVAETIRDLRPPHWSTLYRWVTRLRKAAGDVRALIPATDRRGNRTRRMDAEVIRLVEEGIDRRFLNRERSPARAAHDFALCRIDELNRGAPSEHRLRLPSLRSVYRAIRRRDDYQVTAARFGKRTADLKYRVTGQAPKPTRPLQRVEIDHTKLDMIVVDDVLGEAIGRPWLTLAVDVHTRMPVGFHMGFDQPGFDTVMRCLRHAILPKTYVAERYPDIRHTWECYGVPEVVVVDNGREFHSADFELACRQLDILIEHTPRKSPWMKGTVERFFGQLNQGLIHSQPGTTFSNIIERGDYDSRRNGVISFSLLVELFHHWVIDIYARSLHRGLQDLPGDRWRAAAAEYPPPLPAKASDVDIVLARTHQCTLHHYGVEVSSLIYNSDELGVLRRRHQGRLRTLVKQDVDDLSHVLVLDPDREVFLKVPAVSQEYTRGLTLWQHRVIRAEAKRSRAGRLDIIDLARARERLVEKASQAWAGLRRIGTRQKVARFLGIDSRSVTDPAEAEPPIVPVAVEPLNVPMAAEAEAAPPPSPTKATGDDDLWGADYQMPPRR